MTVDRTGVTPSPDEEQHQWARAAAVRVFLGMKPTWPHEAQDADCCGGMPLS